MRIYAASSWRNERHPDVVEALRAARYMVYDFRHPEPGNDGFSWDKIDPGWQEVTEATGLRKMLNHPVAQKGFRSDMDALTNCDVCVLTLPCGRSAHLELGYAVGAGKPTFVLLDGESGLELMYGMVTELCEDISELLSAIEESPDEIREAVMGSQKMERMFGGTDAETDERGGRDGSQGQNPER